ncbi:carboxylating nicotinate-nucleotide diphosphorylase [Desulfobacterales bacterium HSG17]|nr:carboxylating nicotinate-nucleotide diphosphorylase [Desulfobacterales bacterium HSG17]
MYSIKNLIRTALEEDIGSGDITTDNIIGSDLSGSGEIIAKEPLIIAGLDIARQVFEELDPGTIFTPAYSDGDSVNKGEKVLEVRGTLRALLKGERTALNFLQRLSGIASNVHSYVNVLKGKPVRLVDTRKTAPGWRTLEKYAVRTGGAYNHRMGLYDGVLIKDNHIAVSGSIDKAVKKVRENISHLIKVEVEVTNMDEVQQALDAKADIIMLDNMDIPRITAAVKLINKAALVEVSGNVTIDNLSGLADTGVDIISSGALTHSAGSVDLSMRINLC